MKLTEIKGIGPKTEELFCKIGVDTVEDLVRYYPIHYDQFSSPVAVGSLAPGTKNAVRGTLAGRVMMRQYGGKSFLTSEISDPTGKLQLNWYNAPYVRNILRPGVQYIFRGMVTERKGRRIMEHPEIYTPKQYAEKENRLLPVYAVTKGLTVKTVSRTVKEALKILPLTNEYLPETMLRMNGLADETWAVRHIHFPETEENLEKARKRLSFDEFFLFLFTMRRLKENSSEKKTAFPMKRVWETENLIHSLPYTLTKAQLKVWHEIENDLASPVSMSRLVEGDVGSGKTILAFLAMLMTAANGYQGALMAPTEVLARQHYEKLMTLKEKQQLDTLAPVLLTGSTPQKERKQILDEIASGKANAVVGTHALFQESVSYRKLALVITDEQHRFGVRQREALLEKGELPNTMVMSATPIPRTLAVVFYGDLDVSVIDEMPARRLPVKNAVVGEGYRRASMSFIKKQVDAGRQVYVICPMIEPNDEFPAANVIDERNSLKRLFPDYTIGLMHGRLSPDEKEEVMRDFVSGKTQILVSTTVVEVGVDVPNATVMLIENAERFGLATLHQLRGRVGRGEYQSYCIFMTGEATEETRKRLEILQHSNNGFEIAKKDLELRGPGDLLGIRQSGDALFKIADLMRDRDMLVLAGETVSAVMEDDPALVQDENQLLKKELALYQERNEKNLVL